MKRIATVFTIFLLLSFTSGCGPAAKKVSLPAGVSGDIYVQSLGADTSRLNEDQKALLQETLNWMDKDLLNTLKRSGFNPNLIKNENDFKAVQDGFLLKMKITDHKMIPKGARFLGGMMAGNDRLNAHYDFIDNKGKVLLSWDDVQNSTRGGRYCAQVLNTNTVNKIVAFISGS